MKKAVIVILFWMIGAYLVHIPLIWVFAGGAAILAIVLSGAYHKIIGRLAVVMLVWGVSVAGLGAMDAPGLYAKAASIKTLPFEQSSTLDAKLKDLDIALAEERISQQEYDQLRASVLESFVSVSKEAALQD